MENLVSYLKAIKVQLCTHPEFAKRVEQLLKAQEQGQSIEESCRQLADDMEIYAGRNISKSNIVLLLLFSWDIKKRLGSAKTTH